MESNVQHVVKQDSKSDGKNVDAFLEWSSSSASACSSTAIQSSKSYKGRSGHQTLTTIRRPLARVGMMPIIIPTASSTLRHPVQLSLPCGGLKERHESTG